MNASLLLAKPVRITKIRESTATIDSFNNNDIRDNSEFMNIGINEDEESYIRLLSQTSLTHGTVVEINDTGTMVSIRSPGVIVGGGLPTIIHDC